MDFIRIAEYIGFGGFILWSLIERGFTFSKQQQREGQRKAQLSFWLILIFWYAAMFLSIWDVWGNPLTAFQQPFLALRIVGIILTLGGLLLRFAAHRALGQSYSVHVETSQKHKLVTSGIFSILRHPAYLDLLCLFLGIPLCMGSWGGLLIAGLGGIPVIIYRIRIEERVLVEWFGEAYKNYLQNTWRLIPYLW